MNWLRQSTVMAKRRSRVQSVPELGLQVPVAAAETVLRGAETDEIERNNFV